MRGLQVIINIKPFAHSLAYSDYSKNVYFIRKQLIITKNKDKSPIDTESYRASGFYYYPNKLILS